MVLQQYINDHCNQLKNVRKNRRENQDPHCARNVSIVLVKNTKDTRGNGLTGKTVNQYEDTKSATKIHKNLNNQNVDIKVSAQSVLLE